MEMDTDMGRTTVDMDRLPIKRLDAIEESGIEHFPPELGYEEKRLQMIRRIDFSWVLDREEDEVDPEGDGSIAASRTKKVKKKKKKKKKKKEGEEAEADAPAWQGLVENLHMAQQELAIIIDLIGTVEANDIVTVAGMQRPKQSANEAVSDLAVSAATKLQRLRVIYATWGYFKQSSKALEQQVAREARFYGSLIRIQQNWKVKRQRLAASGPGSEGFMIDLFDTTLWDSAFLRPSSTFTVHLDRDSSGMLAVQQQPLKSNCFLHLRFTGKGLNQGPNSLNRGKGSRSSDRSGKGEKQTLTDDNVSDCVEHIHSTLREIHQSIFEEQVFGLVNRETFNPSRGVNVTGIQEDFLQLGIGQEASLCLYLKPREKEEIPVSANSKILSQDEESELPCSDSLGLALVDKKDDLQEDILALPNPSSLEIFLENIFHENVTRRARERQSRNTGIQLASRHVFEGHGLLGHFCMTISHRIFSRKVLSQLECLVNRVPYLHLISDPAWFSRTSSWSLLLNVPQSILHSRKSITSEVHHDKSGISSQFRTKVVVNDDQININGEGAPIMIGSFKGSSADTGMINSYDCDLQDLPLVLLQQVASQIICWLYHEALQVGMKVNKDFQCLHFELDQGELLGLVAHVDPEDDQGCISWWIVMDDGHADGGNIFANDIESENKRFLGYLSLETLYSTLMDLLCLCSSAGNN